MPSIQNLSEMAPGEVHRVVASLSSGLRHSGSLGCPFQGLLDLLWLLNHLFYFSSISLPLVGNPRTFEKHCFSLYTICLCAFVVCALYQIILIKRNHKITRASISPLFELLKNMVTRKPVVFLELSLFFLFSKGEKK